MLNIVIQLRTSFYILIDNSIYKLMNNYQNKKSMLLKKELIKFIANINIINIQLFILNFQL